MQFNCYNLNDSKRYVILLASINCHVSWKVHESNQLPIIMTTTFPRDIVSNLVKFVHLKFGLVSYFKLYCCVKFMFQWVKVSPSMIHIRVKNKILCCTIRVMRPRAVRGVVMGTEISLRNNEESERLNSWLIGSGSPKCSTFIFVFWYCVRCNILL